MAPRPLSWLGFRTSKPSQQAEKEKPVARPRTAPYIPTHAASDFLRTSNSTAYPNSEVRTVQSQAQNRSRRNSDSSHSFRFHAETGASGVRNDIKRPVVSQGGERRRSSEKRWDGESMIVSSEAKERRRKSRVMPTSPGLRKYNQAVGTGDFKTR